MHLFSCNGCPIPQPWAFQRQPNPTSVAVFTPNCCPAQDCKSLNLRPWASYRLWPTPHLESMPSISLTALMSSMAWAAWLIKTLQDSISNIQLPTPVDVSSHSVIAKECFSIPIRIREKTNKQRESPGPNIIPIVCVPERKWEYSCPRLERLTRVSFLLCNSGDLFHSTVIQFSCWRNILYTQLNVLTYYLSLLRFCITQSRTAVL